MIITRSRKNSEQKVDMVLARFILLSLRPHVRAAGTQYDEAYQSLRYDDRGRGKFPRTMMIPVQHKGI
jgi:hypothetical protein